MQCRFDGERINSKDTLQPLKHAVKVFTGVEGPRHKSQEKQNRPRRPPFFPGKVSPHTSLGGALYEYLEEVLIGLDTVYTLI